MSDEQLFAPRDRRWIAVVAGVLALALIAVGGALLLRDGDDGRRTAFDPGPEATSASPTPSPDATSESPSASPSPSPSASPTPAVTVSPSASASRRPTPSRSASRTASPAAFVETRDGRPGWGRPEGGCYQATVPTGGAGPYPDLVLDLVLPAGPFRTGNPINAKLRVRNTGSQTRTFTSTDNSDDGVLIQGYARSAYYFTSTTATVSWSIPPGTDSLYDITVQAEQCGDVSTDPAPPLPPGSYEIVASMAWRNGGSGDVWVTPARSITLTS